jgi:hypothetical protein
MISDPRPLVPSDPEGLDDVARQLLEDKPEPTTITGSREFSLESLTDCWRVSGVEYRDGIYVVDLGKVLLDGGSAKTQDDWVEYSRQAIEKGEFHVGDFPLYHALFTTLFRNRENNQHKANIEETRAFLKDKFFKHRLTTLTRIKYTTLGKDKVTHNYGLRDQYEVQEDIVGSNEWVKDSQNPRVYDAILGTDNIAEIQSVYNWITEKNARLWRVNPVPSNIDERAAGFDAGSDRAILGCVRDPQYSVSVLGVFACAEGTPRSTSGGS